jgi:hypothetical protein
VNALRRVVPGRVGAGGELVPSATGAGRLPCMVAVLAPSDTGVGTTCKAETPRTV